MNELEILTEFIGNLIVTEKNHPVLESIMEAVSSMSGASSPTQWSFARDANYSPKKGYFHLATVGNEGIPVNAIKRYGQMPNPTFASNSFFNGSG